jgi:hypothetical protein
MCYSSLSHSRFYLFLDSLFLFSLLSRISLKLGGFNYLFLPKHYVGEEISPAGWRIAPALNPKERRGLSVLLATRLVDQHTRAREGLEWFEPPEHNTLLHCVMYCLGACMNLRVSAWSWPHNVACLPFYS